MFQLVVPRQPLNRVTKPGRSNPFWPGFWSNVSDENREEYRRLYNEKKQRAQRRISALNRNFDEEEKRYYVKAQLEEEANSKGKKPSELWTLAGLKIVETKTDGTITLSGRKRNFETLERLFAEAAFETANNTELGGRQQVLSREIYAVTALHDKNSSLDDRQSEDIRGLLNIGHAEPIDCVMEVHYDRVPDLEDYEVLYNTLIQRFGEEKISKRDPRFFVTNMSFNARLITEEITLLLSDENFNFISYIKIAPHFTSQRTIPNIDLAQVEIGELLTNETVAVIDSGINHNVLNPFVTQQENFLSGAEIIDVGHGTAVASRVLFGDGIFESVIEGRPLIPVGRLLDLRVLHLNEEKYRLTSDQVLMDALERVIRRYPSTNVVNLSLADDVSAKERPDELTEYVDDLLNKNDLIVVNAVGNHNGNYSEGYEGTFNNDALDIHISSPSDALNVISVGSIANVADQNTLCRTPGAPSPFTRKGGIRNDIKKPELVANGGNVQVCPRNAYEETHMIASTNSYGVGIIGTSGLEKNIGTSFSAPLVTREATLLLDYLKHSGAQDHLPRFTENKANLVKALLIHSTERGVNLKLSNALKRAYGFGVPNQAAVTRDDENQITIIYADRVEAAQKKQQLMIDLPDFLLGQQVEFVFSMTYNPPVNKNFQEYKMITLQASLATFDPALNEEGDAEDEGWKTISPSHSWNKYKAAHFNSFHFKKKLQHGLSSTRMRVNIQMLVASEYEKQNLGQEHNIFQNYAFALTIRDLSDRNELRSYLLESEQFIELSENVHVDVQ